MKKIITLLLVASLLVFPVMTAFAAEGSTNITGGTVEWDGSKLKSNLSDIRQAVNDMQPGDKVTYTVEVKNSSSVDTDFWMSNSIIKSFEDNSSASNGAYTYYLAFKGPDGNVVFYDSAAVGGEDTSNGVGLHEATNTLEQDFMLATLSKGESGTVTLIVALDGETQGNAYQNATGALELQFGVEQQDITTKTNTKTVTKTITAPSNVKTGDDFNRSPLYIAALAAGVLLIVVATGRRKKAAER